MNRALLSTCFVFLCCPSPVPVRADTVQLDPGPPGSTFTSKFFIITHQLEGVIANGNTLDLDFEFTDMKHLEFDLGPSGITTSRFEGRLSIFWDAPVRSAVINDPDAFLTAPPAPDMPVTIDSDTVTTHSHPRATGWVGQWTIDEYPDIVQFHGLYKTITLATGTGGTPAISLATFSLRLIPDTDQQFKVSPEPGDYDGDGDVDGSDFLKWQQGESPNPLSALELADWEANFGTIASPATATSEAVPEPASAVLVLIGAASMCVTRRRRLGRVPKLVSA